MADGGFRAGQVYDNVYLLFVDCAGHSAAVSSNPRDRVTWAYDLFHERVVGRLTKTATEHGCARAEAWRWAGDGGFLVVHDDAESVARDTTLDVARHLLAEDLPQLRREFERSGIAGRLRIRAAVHKGPLRYVGDGLQGLVYSPDINFAAHLERATPPDTVALSEDVYRVAGPYADMCEPAGVFEGRTVYLMMPVDRHGDGLRSWLATRGLPSGVPVHAYLQRPSQYDKACLVDAAVSEVVDLGTVLNTCSNYLVTTERPARYRDATLDFLGRGGVYRCVLMDPRSRPEGIELAGGADLVDRIERSVDRFRRFKQRHGSLADNLRVYYTRGYPGLASLVVDSDRPHAMYLYSPYLHTSASGRGLERGDMPHYFVSRSTGPLFEAVRATVGALIADEVTERIL
jgi:class 3 adenylate cyclase